MVNMRETLAGDSYTNAVLALATDDVRQRMNDDVGLVEVVKYLVEGNTAEDLVFLYLRTVLERDKEVFDELIDEILMCIDRKEETNNV